MIGGELSALTSAEKDVFSAEELEQGYRLACQAYPQSDCKIRVPPESITAQQRTQVEGMTVTVTPEPCVRAYAVTLAPASLTDLRADDERLLTALEEQHKVQCAQIDTRVLQDFSARLRTLKWQVKAFVHDGEVIALNSVESRHLGLAVDVGTTKIAGYLVDLTDGRTLASAGIMNPQVSYGEDVITRIGRAKSSSAEAAKMQELVVTALNQIVIDLCSRAGAKTEEVVEAVVVGNTAMHHLFARLPVAQLGLAPYVPAVSRALDIKAHEVGLTIAPGAYVHLLPNIAGFVGADLVAGLLAIDALRVKGTVLYIDIGTNTEVCLISDGEMTSVSCASGPAFEGAHIQCGMRAASGAIERLRLVGEKLEYKTIDSAPPVGLCGSGILDAVAQMYRAGIVDRTGRIEDRHPRVHTAKGKKEFVIVSEAERDGGKAVTVSQMDIRELQLAKGAIYTGIKLLLEAKNLKEQEIEQIIIAGAFGSYIDMSSAITIGMLPDLPLKKFRQIGNAAGTGARLALISCKKRMEAQEIADRVDYIELAAVPAFMNTFVEAIYLGRESKGGS